MRRMIVVVWCFVTMAAVPGAAQTDRTKATLYTSADLKAALGKQNGTNLQGARIDGGTRLAFNAGDFIMVPSGVPHQFVDLTAPVRVMSMYLPNK